MQQVKDNVLEILNGDVENAVMSGIWLNHKVIEKVSDDLAVTNAVSSLLARGLNSMHRYKK